MHSAEKRKSSFEDVFPLPGFLELPLVGIDVSDRSIKFIELKKKKDYLEVARYGEEAIAEGVIVDGEIKDPGALSEVLKRFSQKEKIKIVHASLPEEKAFLVKAKVPDVGEEGVRTNLSFQLEKKVPVPLSEAVFDYDITGKIKKSGMANAVVTVFPEDFIKSYLDAFKAAGVIPISFEIEAQAIARAVVPENKKETVMIIDFGHSRTGLSIVSGGVVSHTSTIEIGGNEISRQIKESLGVEDKEADDFKNKIGLRKGKNQELYISISHTILALKDEVNKHLNYWKAHVDEGLESPVTEIIICGGNANLAGFAEYLESALGVEVNKANVWANLFSFEDYIPPIHKQHSLGYATAIGLALNGLK